MKKTSLYLDPEVDRQLARMAENTGITKAELIRRTLAEATSSASPRSPRTLGVFEGPGDAAANVDDYLRRTGFGAR